MDWVIPDRKNWAANYQNKSLFLEGSLKICSIHETVTSAIWGYTFELIFEGLRLFSYCFKGGIFQLRRWWLGAMNNFEFWRQFCVLVDFIFGHEGCVIILQHILPICPQIFCGRRAKQQHKIRSLRINIKIRRFFKFIKWISWIIWRFVDEYFVRLSGMAWPTRPRHLLRPRWPVISQLSSFWVSWERCFAADSLKLVLPIVSVF